MIYTNNDNNFRLRPGSHFLTYVHVHVFLQPEASGAFGQAVAVGQAVAYPVVVHRPRHELIAPVFVVLRHLSKEFHKQEKQK